MSTCFFIRDIYLKITDCTCCLHVSWVHESLLAPIQITCLWITPATTVWLRAVTCMSTWVWVCLYFCVLCIVRCHYHLNNYVKGHFCNWQPCSNSVHHSTEFLDYMWGADTYPKSLTKQKHRWDSALFLSCENLSFQIIVCKVVLQVDHWQFPRCQHCNKRFRTCGGWELKKKTNKCNSNKKYLYRFDNTCAPNLLHHSYIEKHPASSTTDVRHACL